MIDNLVTKLFKESDIYHKCGSLCYCINLLISEYGRGLSQVTPPVRYILEIIKE